MKMKALGGFVVSAFLLAGLTACVGAGTSTDTTSAAGLESAAGDSPKMYTRAELGQILGDVRDSNDVRLLLMRDDRLEDTLKVAKDVVTNSTVEPAACAGFAVEGSELLEPGATVNMGVSEGSNEQAMVSLTLVSGLPEDRAKEIVTGKSTNVASCESMQVTFRGHNIEASTKSMTTSVMTEGAVAYKTSAIVPGDGPQEQLILTAAKRGVILIGQSYGTTVPDADLAKLESMLDQAAALIK